MNTVDAGKQKSYVGRLSLICGVHPQHLFGKSNAYVKSFGRVVYLNMRSLAITHEHVMFKDIEKDKNPFKNVNPVTFEPALKRLIGKELFEGLPKRFKIKNGKYEIIKNEIERLGKSLVTIRRFFKFIKKVVLNRELNAKNITNYVGSESIIIREVQEETNNEILGRRTFTTGNGEKKSILDVIDDGKRRAAELVIETKGLENFANSRGMTWMMITLTIPARFHSNPKFGKNTFENGTTIDDCLNFFRERWNNMRKLLSKNEELKFCENNAFGIKVIEPHSDGTPHWHIMFFCMPDKVGQYQEIFKTYFRHSKSAIDFIVEDKTLGVKAASASSYLFKYITKFTGGEKGGEKSDISSDAMKNVKTWRSACQVRSFEKFGIRGVITKFRRLRVFENRKRKVIITKTKAANEENFKKDCDGF
jgi:hypothetical protein